MVAAVVVLVPSELGVVVSVEGLSADSSDTALLSSALLPSSTSSSSFVPLPPVFVHGRSQRQCSYLSHLRARTRTHTHSNAGKWKPADEWML